MIGTLFPLNPLFQKLYAKKHFFSKKIENALVFRGAHRGDFAKKNFLSNFTYLDQYLPGKKVRHESKHFDENRPCTTDP